jgi:hypothetical protein
MHHSSRPKQLCLLALTLICLTTFQPTAYSQETKKPLTNADVVKLLENGFGDEQIIRTIEASPSQFDISADALIELKKAGVSQTVISAMLKAAPKTTPVASESPPAPVVSTPPAQPYALIASTTTKPVLSANVPTVVQTKAKGDNLGTILADSVVQDISSTAITSVAASAITATPGVATLPIVGAAGAVMLKMPGMRRDPTFTYVYALAGRQSSTVIDTTNLNFELFFGDVVGANPDDFEAVIIKISPTNNNWRLIGAQKTKAKYFESGERTELNFIEEKVLSKTTKLGRGHVQLEPEKPLTEGEYGVVLRPVSKSQKISLKDTLYRQGEGILVGIIWDFSVRPKTP